LIAGGGDFPLQALGEAKKQGYVCVVAGMRGAAAPELKRDADAFEWFGPTELEKLVSFLKSREVRDAVLVGKVEHRTIFRKDLQDEAVARLPARISDQSPSSVLKTLIDYLTLHGLNVLDPAIFLAPFLCPEGRLGSVAASEAVLAEAAFGWPLAKALADLDIGQTMIVKGRAVVAVEGMEGTDETIRRGARLAGEGVVVLKVGRTRQDMRIDVPAVGLETMRTLVQARAVALVIETGNVPFFQKDEALALAEAEGIAVIVKR
jgi:hypothetical protein